MIPEFRNFESGVSFIAIEIHQNWFPRLWFQVLKSTHRICLHAKLLNEVSILAPWFLRDLRLWVRIEGGVLKRWQKKNCIVSLSHAPFLPILSLICIKHWFTVDWDVWNLSLRCIWIWGALTHFFLVLLRLFIKPIVFTFWISKCFQSAPPCGTLGFNLPLLLSPEIFICALFEGFSTDMNLCSFIQFQ